MKASYDCFSVIKVDLDKWLAKNKPNGRDYSIKLSCISAESTVDDSSPGAKPQGGFNNKLYVCDIV
jgi:hypothetical protein